MALFMTKDKRLKELKNNIEDLTVEDFFLYSEKIVVPYELIGRNEEWRKSSEILLYVLKSTMYAFEYFSEEAFNEEVLAYIAKFGQPVDVQYFKKFPILLTNNTIIANSIKHRPEEFLKLLSNDDITKEVIEVLEKIRFVPTKSDVIKFPSLLTSNKLVNSRLADEPTLIKDIRDLNKDIVFTAMRAGYVPTKEDIMANPSMMEYSDLMLKAVEKDPSIVAIIDEEYLNSVIESTAVEYGYVPTEKDIQAHPYFIKWTNLMSAAIKNDPSLIRYITFETFVPHLILVDALKKYKVTKNDIINYPGLTTHSIMSELPQYSLYYKYVRPEEKRDALFDYFVGKKKTSMVEALPFLDPKYSAIVEFDKFKEVLDALTLDVNEDKLEVQQDFGNILNQVIERTAYFRNKRREKNPNFSDIASLNRYMNQVFADYREDALVEFIDEVCEYTHGLMDFNFIHESIMGFYDDYLGDFDVDLSHSEEFLNKVLNANQNYFTSIECNKMKADLKQVFKIGDKYIKDQLDEKRFKQVKGCIARGQYDVLGTTEKAFDADCNEAVKDLLASKKLSKLGVEITEEMLDKVVQLFKRNGYVDEETLKKKLRLTNTEVVKTIVKKFDSIKKKLSKSIKLGKGEDIIDTFEYEKLEFNGSNFNIYNRERYLFNLSTLLGFMDRETFDMIYDNLDNVKEVAKLLALVDFVDEFSLKAFVNMLKVLDRINYKLGTKKNDLASVLKRFDRYLELGEAFASINDIDCAILGKDVVSVVDEYRVSKFIPSYLATFNRTTTNVPPVYYEQDGYTFESGRFRDEARLMVGFIPHDDSCITPYNFAGVDTFNEVILGDLGDLIVVRDENNKMVDRVLLIRRGNTVQMILKGDRRFNVDVYKNIAIQMMDRAIKNNDNIEYIYLNGEHNGKGLKVVEDYAFKYDFGHADTVNKATLMVSRKDILGFKEEIPMNLVVAPSVTYPGLRKVVNYNPSGSEIDKLNALDIKFESEEALREIKSRNFTPFMVDEYKDVACGDDWYIAVDYNGNISEVILPTAGEEALEEIEAARIKFGINGKRM